VSPPTQELQQDVELDTDTNNRNDDETQVSQNRLDGGEKRGMKRQRQYNDHDPNYDRFGHRASASLFIDRLPENISTKELSNLFQRYAAIKEIQLGNKTLQRGEFRTAVVKFYSAEEAIQCRNALQHYQDKDWENPILINFVKMDEPSERHSDGRTGVSGGINSGAGNTGFRHRYRQQSQIHSAYSPIPYDSYYYAPHQYYVPPSSPSGFSPSRGRRHYYTSPTPFISGASVGGASAGGISYHQSSRRVYPPQASSPHYQPPPPPPPPPQYSSYYHTGGYVMDMVPSPSPHYGYVTSPIAHSSVSSIDVPGYHEQYRQHRHNNSSHHYHYHHHHNNHRQHSNRVTHSYPLQSITIPTSPTQKISGSPLDQDKLGNTACPCLFVKNFSRFITEECIRNAFPSVKHILMGTKNLQYGEHRTAYLYFEDVQTAVQERNRLNNKTIPMLHYKPKVSHSSCNVPANNGNSLDGSQEQQYHEDLDMQQPLMIYYSKRPQDQQPHSSSNVLNYFFDSRGNPATNCLFVDQLPYNISESEIHRIFDKFSPVNIVVGNKQLTPNEFRTALVYFATVQQAVNCRSELQNYRIDNRVITINYRRIR
jgi:RNA recognition motif-containing protein